MLAPALSLPFRFPSPKAAMTSDRRLTLLATLGLIAMTAVWGSTFVLIKDVVGRMPVADFLAVRFVVAAVAMLAVCSRSVRQLERRQMRRALVLGAIYGGGQLLQTWGLSLIAPSVSGFVTGMYVVFTPILSLVLLRQRVAAVVWVAVLLATAGLGLLSLHGWSIDTGVWLTLASAALYALHIVWLGRWSRASEAVGMSAVQMVAIAAVCLLATLPHGPTLPPDPRAWLAVLYMALVAGAGAMVMQSWAQAHLPAARAAIVMTTEPVFAAAFAVAFGSDVLTGRMLAGGALVLAAMYLVELLPPRSASDLPAEAVHHEV
jgi:drug/metabolite transporter (DMT)-like permease